MVIGKVKNKKFGAEAKASPNWARSQWL